LESEDRDCKALQTVITPEAFKPYLAPIGLSIVEKDDSQSANTVMPRSIYLLIKASGVNISIFDRNLVFSTTLDA